MKPNIRRWLGLAIVPAAALTLFAASPAYAADYTGMCSGLPSSVSGNVIISQGSACTIPNNVTATGYIQITAPSISGSGKTLISNGGQIKLNSNGGALNVDTLQSSNNVDLDATGAITLKNITATYAIDIDTPSSVTLDTSGSLTSTYGDISIDGTSIEGKTITTGNGEIKLNATNGIIDVETFESGNNVDLDATGEITVKTITAEYDIDIDTTDNVTLDSEEVQTSNNGNITIDGADIESGEIYAPGGHIKIVGDNFTTADKKLSSRYEIDIQTEDGDVDMGTGNLETQDWYIHVKADNITVGDVKVENAGHIVLLAQEDLSVKDIDGANPPSGNYNYNIDLQVNKGASSATTFEIGTTGTNAVKSITAHPLGNPATYANGVIFVRNNKGNITISDNSAITASGANGRGNYLFLEAKDGTLTIPGTNALASNGTGSNGGGAISLQADTINFGAGAEVSASQTSTTGTLHGVTIAAETVNHNGLTLKGNGDGYDQYSTGHVHLLPKDSVTVTDNESPTSSSIYGTINYSQTGDITYTGNGELKIEANGGDNNRVYVYATKSTFSGSGAVNIESMGGENHIIQFGTNGSHTGSNGTYFLGSGAVTLNATAEDGGNGGDISFYVDKLKVDAPVFTLDANGPSQGNGDGGTVYVGTTNGFEQNASTVATITADAASNGTGDAVYSDLTGYDPKAITLWAGPSTVLKLGTDSGQVTLSAKGGSSGGRGGAAVISGYSVELRTDDAVHVEAQSGNGDGGGFLSWANISAIGSGLNGPVIDAQGHGTGEGGKVQSYRALEVSFDVHKLIKVDGGDSIQTSDFHGSITLNNVTCRQWKNTHTWPATHWNCTGNDPEEDEDLVPDTVAYNLYTVDGLTTFETNKVVISVFTNATDMGYWFSLTPNTAAGGYTIKDTGWDHIYVNPFLNGTRGKSGETITYSEVQMAEVAAHEMGHAMDIIRTTGGVFQSHSTAYNSYVLRDLHDLDFVWDATLPTPAFIPREPCQATQFHNGSFSTEAPPFVNVTNLHTTNAVCVSGALNTTDFAGTWSNSQVLNAIEAGFWSSDPNQHWHEPYAHTFGHQNVGTQGARPMYDEVLDQGYFVCIKAWADALLDGNTTPSPTPNGWSGSCGTAPGGYTPF